MLASFPKMRTLIMILNFDDARMRSFIKQQGCVISNIIKSFYFVSILFPFETFFNR